MSTSVLEICPDQLLQVHGFQRAVPRNRHQPQSFEKGKFLDPRPDLFSEKLWGWGPAIGALISPTGDSDAH